MRLSNKRDMFILIYDRLACHFMGFVVRNVALRQVFLEVLQFFSCQLSFHRPSIFCVTWPVVTSLFLGFLSCDLRYAGICQEAGVFMVLSPENSRIILQN